MDRRKLILIAVTAVILGIAALIATQRALAPDSRTNRPSLFEVASVEPVQSAARTPLVTPSDVQTPSTSPVQIQVASTPSATSVATPTTAASQPFEMTNPDGDLKSSQTRLNAIDDISAAADELFAPTGADPSWSVNQQGMDQIDYQSPDGNTAITKWFSSGEDGSSAVQAEEAQLPNGELIDRWYNDNGGAQQVMHQYDKNNSYSVYYYDTGEIEATRVIKDGNEIFTKYDRDGRQIQRTYTPASAN